MVHKLTVQNLSSIEQLPVTVKLINLAEVLIDL